ncbi:MAG: molybdopterin-dependent oxidoreductase [Clostridia bacterium]|nr:molybdopterin-dependent oxidoreductase [Clostridia bacterium]
MKAKQLLLGMAAALALGVSVAFAAEAPAVVEDPLGAANDYINELNDRWKKIGEDYAPEIRTLDNGVKVQRTPSEYQITGWMWQSDTISYNTYWLDADNRGCLACHKSLDDLIMNMNYEHPAFWNTELGVNTGVQQCLICHTLADGYITSNYDFGTLIHAIHYAKDSHYTGNCMSCHNMTKDGMGVQLWDLVKYQKMVGIENVADVQGEFSFTQDKVQKMAEMFSYDWMHSDADNLRHALGVHGANVQPPQEMFDEWDFSVHGLVNEPFTMKLPELIAKAEAAGAVKTKISKMVCDWCAVGGGGITNVEITGIPLRWLLEQAGGWDEKATGVIFDNVDGAEGSTRCVRIDRIDQVYLVYKVGGEYLDGGHGYPVTNWYEAVDAQSNKKQITGYTVTADLDWEYYDKRIPNGWMNDQGGYDNKPNATILNVPEGLLIETGVPHTFEGYADAYDQKIASIEFSMDQGKTWTKYDLGDTDVTKWVYWNWTWTPQTDASYVLTVRATTEEGLVSTTLHSVMVTARTNIAELG